MSKLRIRIGLLIVFLLLMITSAASSEDWLQFKYDAGHSGDVPDRSVKVPLGLSAPWH